MHRIYSPLKFLTLLVLAGALMIALTAQTHAVTSKAKGTQQAQDSALAQGFAPHKALYDVSMIDSKNGTQLINVSGKMLYEWQPSCEGWVSNHRFNLTYEYADSPPHEVVSDFSNFERFDGNRLDFTSQRKRGGAVYEEIRGHAEKPPETADGHGDHDGNAVYKLPRGLVYDLPPRTLFPVGHTLEVLKAAQKGQKFFSAAVFDGSDEEGPVEINAFIGKEKPADKALLTGTSENIDKALLTDTAHKVRLAFFPLSQGSSAPELSLIHI